MSTVNLVELRQNVAEATKRGYGAVKEYAKGLNQEFSFAWFEVEAQDQSEAGKAVKAEKAEFYKPMKSVGHANPSTVWARVRAEGLADAKANELFGYTADVETEDSETETEGSGASHARSPMLRNIEELTKLYKFNKGQTGLDPKIVKAQQKISEALIELGINLTMLASK
jgi:hypothetical protein